MNESNEFRYLGTCKFCGEEIYGNHHNKYQAHQRWCLKNPNRNKALNQIKAAAKNGSKVSNSNRAAKAKVLNEKHEHVLKCRKCNHDYVIWVSDRYFEKGLYPKYCSKSCANSRNANEFKDKISVSVSKEHEHVCPKCHTTFMHKGTNINNTYCDLCYKEIFGVERGFVKANKQIKGHGKFGYVKKIGNDMPLHKVECYGCKKTIWCKTSDEVYCYECAKQLGKVVHQLYTPYGKKLVSTDTKKKLKDLVEKRIENGTHNGWKTRSKHSYAEIFWMKVLDNNNISYEAEAGVPGYLYHLDFKITLPNRKIVDLEIDGKQHYYADRNQHDILRDKRMRALGYLVYRIPWNSITNKLGKMRMSAKINQFIWWLDKVSK